MTFEKKKNIFFCNCEKIFDEPENSGVTTVNVSSAMDYALAGWMFGDVLMRSPANIELQAYHKANAQAKGLNEYLKNLDILDIIRALRFLFELKILT